MDVDAFAANGFVKIEQTVPRECADAARRALWDRIPMSPHRPDTWTEPVVWTADLDGAGPFGMLARSPTLAAALDEICGVAGWTPRGSLGNVVVRFPVPPVTDDRGWHVDLNTPLPDGTWAVSGRPHTLLLLTILSDVGPDDAPTRIRVGSHRDVAAVLDERPVDAYDCGPLVDAVSAHRDVAVATGDPGDVYLVHPLTVHAADEHRGCTPRFMAQAPIMLASPLTPRTASPLGAAW